MIKPVERVRRGNYLNIEGTYTCQVLIIIKYSSDILILESFKF